MKVFIVGDHGPEHNSIRSIHKTYAGAFREWEKLRLELLADAKRGFEWSRKDAKETLKEGTGYNGEKLGKESIRYYRERATKGGEMYIRMIKNLKCRDPKKMDNFPQETPYIYEHEVKE